MAKYNQLIARRVRECNVYAEVHPLHDSAWQKIKEIESQGNHFLQADPTVYTERSSPRCPKEIFEMGIPILGICYGSQLMAYMLGGKVETAPVSEYGHTDVTVDTDDILFEGVSKETVAWMSHTDYIAQAPEGFKITAHTSVVSGSSYVLSGEKVLRYTVPSGSYAYRRRKNDAE